jgi:hypothetical protein
LQIQLLPMPKLLLLPQMLPLLLHLPEVPT